MPCNINSDIVNQLFVFYKIYQCCDKQCLITTDAENVIPFQSTQSTAVSNSFSGHSLPNTFVVEHRGFLFVDVGFRHTIVNYFDY